MALLDHHQHTEATSSRPNSLSCEELAVSKTKEGSSGQDSNQVNAGGFLSHFLGNAQRISP